MPADMNSVTTNDRCQLECRVAAVMVMAYCYLGRRKLWGCTQSRRLYGYKWQYILIATFSVIEEQGRKLKI